MNHNERNRSSYATGSPTLNCMGAMCVEVSRQTLEVLLEKGTFNPFPPSKFGDSPMGLLKSAIVQHNTDVMVQQDRPPLVPPPRQPPPDPPSPPAQIWPNTDVGNSHRSPSLLCRLQVVGSGIGPGLVIRAYRQHWRFLTALFGDTSTVVHWQS